MVASISPPVFIDALNLAWWGGGVPSLRVPLAVLAQLLQQGREAKLYFDASARHQLGPEQDIYDALLRYAPRVVEARSGVPADRVLLREATAAGALVLSRDKYRDHRRRYRRLIDDPARLATGGVRDGRLRVPMLALDIALPASPQQAWAELEPLLQQSPSRPALDRPARPAAWAWLTRWWPSREVRGK